MFSFLLARTSCWLNIWFAADRDARTPAHCNDQSCRTNSDPTSNPLEIHRFGWPVINHIHTLVASLMNLMASLVTTSRIQQCFNVLIDIYHEFVFFFFYCSVLLGIKLTTATFDFLKTIQCIILMASLTVLLDVKLKSSLTRLNGIGQVGLRHPGVQVETRILQSVRTFVGYPDGTAPTTYEKAGIKGRDK